VHWRNIISNKELLRKTEQEPLVENALPGKHPTGCRLAQRKRMIKLHVEKRSGEGDMESGIQVQLEEDGGGSTEQSWMWRRVVCGLCSTGSDEETSVKQLIKRRISSG